jgi:molybdopterin synthase catalytic subunit
MPPVMPVVRIQHERLRRRRRDRAAIAGKADVGAVVTFTGLCRDEAGSLAALELEHYPGMAEAEITAHREEALRTLAARGLTAIHRFGKIGPARTSCWWSRRLQAPAAPPSTPRNFLMDYLKSRAPFWKKEHLARRHARRSWVDAKDSDDEAAERWRSPERCRPRLLSAAIEPPYANRSFGADAPRLRSEEADGRRVARPGNT